MKKIAYLNPISEKGTALWTEEYEKTESVAEADAVMVRSAAMHDMELPKNLLAVARAGAGVNNIPLNKCADQGIVVFNTPGANANAVKELVILGLLIGSRKVASAMEWVQGLKGSGAEVSNTRSFRLGPVPRPDRSRDRSPCQAAPSGHRWSD